MKLLEVITSLKAAITKEYLDYKQSHKADQMEWNCQYEDHLCTAKHVKVVSAIVGNHTYSVSRSWTWERLIEDRKILLTINENDPNRIVSTDKKAVEASDLCLALKGVLVKPTDDVDVEKEYELVAMEGGSSDVTPIVPE